MKVTINGETYDVPDAVAEELERARREAQLHWIRAEEFRAIANNDEVVRFEYGHRRLALEKKVYPVDVRPEPYPEVEADAAREG